MTYATYCSREKRRDPAPLPPLERYTSARIRAVAARAAADGARFLILSGRYGLLGPDDAIPWYDHLLDAGEVDAMIATATAQLRVRGVTELVWFTVSPEADPGVGPYGEVVRRAAAAAGVAWREEIIQDTGD